MKKFLILASFVCFVAAFAISCDNKEEPKEPADKPQTEQVDKKDTETPPPPAEEKAEEPEYPGWTKLEAPIEGKVVSFGNMATGKAELTLDDAKKCAEDGGMFGVKSGDKVYLVYGIDKSNASKKLAEYADKEAVVINGYYKEVNGLHCIMMEELEAK